MFVPALLPVLLLALGAAVEGDLALGAGAVLLDAGDGSLGCAAVGAVAEGRRGACTSSFFAFAFALASSAGCHGRGHLGGSASVQPDDRRCQQTVDEEHRLVVVVVVVPFGVVLSLLFVCSVS